jgi:hypothetical protein
MSPTLLDPIAVLNPLPDEAAEHLAIKGAEDDMLAAIVAVSDHADVTAPRARSPRSPRRVLAVAGLAAVVLPVVAVLAVLPTGRSVRRLGPPAAPVVTGALKRFADASPRVLLQERGWRVWHADQQSRLWGELDFKHIGSSTGGGLTWFPKSDTRGYIQDRGSEAAIRTTMPLLGTTAHVYQLKGARLHGNASFTAIWTMGARGLMFETGAPNMRAFRGHLAHLRVVDYATWTAARRSARCSGASRCPRALTPARSLVRRSCASATSSAPR